MIPQLPESVKPAIPIGLINAPIPLYSGDLVFSGKLKSEIVGNGTVRWEWQPHSEVRFEAQVSDVDSLFNTEGILVSTKGSLPTPVMITSARGFSSGVVSGRIGVFKYGENEPIDRMVFHLPNYINYMGKGIQDTSENGRHCRRGRLVFEVDDWRIVLDNWAGTEETIEKLQREGGFGITHIGEVCRIDKACFEYADVIGLIDAFSYFLSFSRGFWTQPILHIGMRACVGTSTPNKDPNKVCVVAENLILSPWHEVLTWCSKYVAENLPDLFKKFWMKWCQPQSRQVLRQVIGWYIEANGASITVEGRLILAQVALEMMGYEVLTALSGVEPGGDAAVRIEKSLKAFQITIVVPSELDELCELAKNSAIKDKPSDKDFSGPKMLTTIRNALVHSKRSKRSKRSMMKGKHFTQAWQLSLWYLELVLLGWLGYDGEYSCRWKRGWEGEVNAVPWMTPKT